MTAAYGGITDQEQDLRVRCLRQALAEMPCEYQDLFRDLCEKLVPYIHGVGPETARRYADAVLWSLVEGSWL